jgi:hypothetical protein
MQSVEINGKSFPFRCSFRALTGFQRETGKGMDALENMDFHDMACLCAHSINSGYKAEGKKQKVSTEDVIDLLDEDMEGLGVIAKALEHDMEQFASLGKK